MSTYSCLGHCQFLLYALPKALPKYIEKTSKRKKREKQKKKLWGE